MLQSLVVLELLLSLVFDPPWPKGVSGSLNLASNSRSRSSDVEDEIEIRREAGVGADMVEVGPDTAAPFAITSKAAVARNPGVEYIVCLSSRKREVVSKIVVVELHRDLVLICRSGSCPVHRPQDLELVERWTDAAGSVINVLAVARWS